MDLDARPYRSFIAIAETRSFNRAAQLLNVSQPALSAQIREFERRLGFPLFVRSSRRVDLTAEGGLFLERARRLVTETEWINNAAREIRTNQLRLGTALFTPHIPERNALIDNFMLDAPDVPLRVLQRSTEHLAEDLKRGDIDAAIFLDVDAPDGVSPFSGATALDRWKIGERPLGLWASAEHPLATRGAVSRHALQGLEVAMIDRSHGVHVAEEVGRALLEAGAVLATMPERDAPALIRLSARAGRCAVDLGWFPGPPSGLVPVQVDGLNLTVALVVAASRANRRAGADRFLETLGPPHLSG